MHPIVRLALFTLALVMIAMGSALCHAEDEPTRARKVKVALALAEAKAEPAKADGRALKVAAALDAAGIPSPPPFVPVPAIPPAPMPREVVLRTCDCDATGSCKCPAGACGCCEKPLPKYDEQARLAVKIGKPLVCYVGCKGHCLDGALVAACDPPAGVLPGVEVLIPKANGNLWEAFRLPAAATKEQIKAAVESATKTLAPKPAAPAPAVTAPLDWFVARPICVGRA